MPAEDDPMGVRSKPSKAERDLHRVVEGVLDTARQLQFEISPDAAEFVHAEVEHSQRIGVIRKRDARVAAAGLVAAGLNALDVSASGREILTPQLLERGWRMISSSLCNPPHRCFKSTVLRKQKLLRAELVFFNKLVK